MGTFRGPRTVKDQLTYSVDFGNKKCFTEGSSSATDLIGGETHTLLNGVTFSSEGGGSLRTSNSDNIAISDGLISPGSNSFTWDIWFLRYTNDNSFNMVAGRYIPYVSARSTNEFRILNNFNGTNIADETTGVSIQNNVWYNITMVYDYNGTSTNFLFYVNAELFISNTYTGTSLERSEPIAIGNWRYNSLTDNYVLNGLVSQFKMYAKALSSDEITQNYNACKSRYY